MNAKKAKAARKLLRMHDKSSDEVTYLRHSKTGQIVAAPASGRGIYNALKKKINGT